jgi:hypothetical protein
VQEKPDIESEVRSCPSPSVASHLAGLHEVLSCGRARGNHRAVECAVCDSISLVDGQAFAVGSFRGLTPCIRPTEGAALRRPAGAGPINQRRPLSQPALKTQ